MGSILSGVSVMEKLFKATDGIIIKSELVPVLLEAINTSKLFRRILGKHLVEEKTIQRKADC